MFILGFALEVVGDQQKYLWKSAKPAKGEINDKGVWVNFLLPPRSLLQKC